MRRLIVIVVIIVGLQLAGYAYLRTMAVDSQGATISQAISLVRARHQMGVIAHAEREEFVTHSQCFSLDELADMGKLDKSDFQRAGYEFSIRCGDEAKFDVVGTHAEAATGSEFRWPVLLIDQDLKFHKADD